jgi:hypothetical protein
MILEKMRPPRALGLIFSKIIGRGRVAVGAPRGGAAVPRPAATA